MAFRIGESRPAPQPAGETTELSHLPERPNYEGMSIHELNIHDVAASIEHCLSWLPPADAWKALQIAVATQKLRSKRVPATDVSDGAAPIHHLGQQPGPGAL